MYPGEVFYTRLEQAAVHAVIVIDQSVYLANPI